MTRHGRPDVSNTICWQQLAGLYRAAQIFSDLAQPMQFSTVSQTIPLEKGLMIWMISLVIDGESFADRESQAMGSSGLFPKE
jgi:hypothetical protein